MRTQIGDIRQYIINHPEGLTSKQAIDLFGCTRLADAIFRLRSYPYNMKIVTIKEVVPNRYGGKSHIAVYKLMD